MVQLDMYSEESRTELVREHASQKKQIDTLINTARAAYDTNSLNDVITNNTLQTNDHSRRRLTEALLGQGWIARRAKSSSPPAVWTPSRTCAWPSATLTSSRA